MSMKRVCFVVAATFVTLPRLAPAAGCGGPTLVIDGQVSVSPDCSATGNLVFSNISPLTGPSIGGGTSTGSSATYRPPLDAPAPTSYRGSVISGSEAVSTTGASATQLAGEQNTWSFLLPSPEPYKSYEPPLPIELPKLDLAERARQDFATLSMYILAQRYRIDQRTAADRAGALQNRADAIKGLESQLEQVAKTGLPPLPPPPGFGLSGVQRFSATKVPEPPKSRHPSVNESYQQVASKARHLAGKNTLRGLAADLALDAAMQASSQNRKEIAEYQAQIALGLTDIAIGFVPVVGTSKDLFEGISGISVLSGRDLTGSDRSIAFAGALSAGILATPAKVKGIREIIRLGRQQREFTEAAMRSLDQADHLLKNFRIVAHHSPIEPGVLSNVMVSTTQSAADTFRGATYYKVVPNKPLDLYRTYSDSNKMLSAYWSTTKPLGPTQAVLDNALSPGFSYVNGATHWVQIRVPAGTELFLGSVAPILDGSKGINLYGGGVQVYSLGEIRDAWRIGKPRKF